ncbi:hypothetical protein BJ165DRAFT_1452343 [Panaeolus papilionaceus]|nr:hypothetical protein BJ165DRAFT_1452343 [Panaeolus papilionaceus]
MDPVFPLEIFEHIISHIASSSDNHSRSNSRDLYSCSLVCMAFVPLCRTHLFRDLTVALDTPKDIQKLGKLAQLITKNPSLKTYLQGITCDPRRSGRGVEGDDKESDEYHLETLLYLPNIHSLAIHNDMQPVDYNHCSPDIFGYRSLIERYLHSGTLTHISLRGITNIPLLPLLSCPELREVLLEAVTLVLWKQEELLPAHERWALRQLWVEDVINFPHSIIKILWQLESLCVSGPEALSGVPSGLLRLPTTPVQFQNLETLIACSGVDWKTLLSVEKHHADVKAFLSVKTLVVELEREVDLHGGNAIFDHLQVLQTLQVTVTPSMDTRLHALRLDKCLADMHHTLKDFTFEIEKGDFSQTIIATICQFLTRAAHRDRHYGPTGTVTGDPYCTVVAF